MISTKHAKIEFGHPVQQQKVKITSQGTLGYGQDRSESIKIIQKGKNERTFFGYKKVNFSEQRKREAYRKINKMLGGN